MYPRMVAIKTQVHMDGTETEKRLGTMLFDDSAQVLSTFELNQVASLTYGDESCDQIFEMLENCMAHPMEFPVLTVQKALVIAKHVLVYGSEKCVNSAWGLGQYVHRLTEFNTVLWAQQQNGVGNWWNQLKGGSVDKGFPVRDEAQKLHLLLSDKNKIQRVRNDKADPNSLVPVGDDNQVGFVSDQVRLYMLRRRMEEQQLIRTKSNLAKADASFGAGYQSKDGKMVVGAAHSIDEMLARAAREKKKYADEGPIHFKPKPKKKQEPDLVSSVPVDLLDFAPTPKPRAPAATPAPAPVMDLLDFGSTPPAAAPTPTSAPVLDIFSPPPMDLLGAAAPAPAPVASNDLLASTTTTTTAEPTPGVNQTSVLLSMMTVSAEPAPPPAMNGLAGGLPSLTPEVSAPEPAKKSVMGSNADRFAALDALAPPDSGNAGSVLSALEAENRILSFSSESSKPATNGITTNGTMPPYGLPEGGDIADVSLYGGLPGSNGSALSLPSYGGLPGSGGLPDSNDPGGMGDGFGSMGGLPGSSDSGGMGSGFGSMGGLPGSTDTVGGSFDEGAMGYMGGEPSMPPPVPPSEPPPLPPNEPPPPPPGTALFESERYGSGGDAGGFYMGGDMGAGLGDPIADAPAAPPPPPPP